MLGFMRKKAGSWMIKMMLGAIIIVFVFWGVGSFHQSRKNQVAVVNGEAITQADYGRAYENELNRLRQRFGGQLTPQMIDQLHLKRQVVENLINQKLLVQEAEKLHLRVSNQELTEAVHSMDIFKTAGSFDRRRYLAFIEQQRMTPDSFEALERQYLLIGKLRYILTGGIIVSDEEARQWYDYLNARVNVDFVLFAPQHDTGIHPTEKELKAYYDAHSAAYKTQPQVKVRYVAFRPEDFVKQVTVPESDIEEYYDEHPAQFHTEKTVQARHILIKVAQNAPAAKVAAARKKIEAILKLARSGKDFAKLARKYSEGPSRYQGGELGTFTKEDMLKPFADKAFSMKPGQISDPVRTRFGWHIIKVEKINPPSTRPLKQVQGEIRAKLAKEKARDMAENVAENAYDTAFSNADLKKTATDLKLDLKRTGFFDKAGDPLRIEGAAKFAAAAFDLDDKEVSSVIKCPDAYYILQRVAGKPAVVPALDAVKSAVRKDLIRVQQEKKAEADARAFLAAVKGGATMTAAAKKYGLPVQSTGFFKRNAAVPHIGNNPQIAQSAFSLSAAKRYPATVLKSQNGYVVIGFKERKGPDPKGFAAQKAHIVKALRQQKEAADMGKWIDRLRAKSHIKISDEYKDVD